MNKRSPNFPRYLLCGPTLQIVYCMMIAVLTLYSLIEQQNQVTELQLRLPVLEKKVKVLREKNNELRYQIAELNSPERQLAFLQEQGSAYFFPDESEVLEIKCCPK